MSDTGWTGQQRLETGQSDYAAHAFLVQRLMARAATIELVQVKAQTGGGLDVVGTVDVQPMVHQIDGRGQPVPHGVIYGLPYMRIQGGSSAVILDPVAGDIGLALFCARDISTVKSTKAPAPPGTRRLNDWADGLYIGGFLNGAPTRYVWFDPSGIKIKDTTKITLEAPEIDLNGPVTLNGDLLVTGFANLGGTGGSPVQTVAGTSTKAKAV